MSVDSVMIINKMLFVNLVCIDVCLIMILFIILSVCLIFIGNFVLVFFNKLIVSFKKSVLIKGGNGICVFDKIKVLSKLFGISL